MSRPLLLVLVLAAAPAAAQIDFSTGLANPTTCAAYLAMTSAEQLEVLIAIQPLGDEIGAADAAAARQWAGEVAAACEGHPDRLVHDAARAALTIR